MFVVGSEELTKPNSRERIPAMKSQKETVENAFKFLGLCEFEYKVLDPIFKSPESFIHFSFHKTTKPSQTRKSQDGWHNQGRNLQCFHFFSFLIYHHPFFIFLEIDGIL